MVPGCCINELRENRDNVRVLKYKCTVCIKLVKSNYAKEI